MDRWLGPAPKVDYRSLAPKENGKQQNDLPKTNCHYEFRWWYEYLGGKLTDWSVHHVDIANWGLKTNGRTLEPISIGGGSEYPVEFKDGFPVQTDRYNTASGFYFVVKYPGDVQIVIRHDTDNGTLIEGDKGRMLVNCNGLVGKPFEDLDDDPLPENAIQKAYKGLPMEQNERKAHWANFLHCDREQIVSISDVHKHMEMLNICHLTGSRADWDANSDRTTPPNKS